MRVRVQINFDYEIDESEMKYNELTLRAQLEIDRAFIEGQLENFLTNPHRIQMEIGE